MQSRRVRFVTTTALVSELREARDARSDNRLTRRPAKKIVISGGRDTSMSPAASKSCADGMGDGAKRSSPISERAPVRRQCGRIPAWPMAGLRRTATEKVRRKSVAIWVAFPPHFAERAEQDQHRRCPRPEGNCKRLMPSTTAKAAR